MSVSTALAARLCRHFLTYICGGVLLSPPVLVRRGTIMSWCHVGHGDSVCVPARACVSKSPGDRICLSEYAHMYVAAGGCVRAAVGWSGTRVHEQVCLQECVDRPECARERVTSCHRM